jgi:hypothetical protein
MNVKHMLVLILVAAAAAGLAGCGGKNKAKNEPEAEAQNAKPPERAEAQRIYECPMHPEVRQAQPGDCPKCGMDLLEVVSPSQDARPGDHAGHHHEGGAAAHSDHNPKHGGMLGMQGDYHLELVARHGGDIEVHLYDAYTKPMSISGAKGTVTLELPESEGRTPTTTVPLEVDASSSALVGRSPDADRAVLATVDVTLPDTVLSMSFPLSSTLSGEIVDIDCYARLGEEGRGPEHAHCAQECIRNGMPVGLSVGNTVYVVTLAGGGRDRAANERLAELAGKHVHLTGRIREVSGLKMIELESVEEKTASEAGG